MITSEFKIKILALRLTSGTKNHLRVNITLALIGYSLQRINDAL